ncbi:MAG: methyltransferase domain-containing protein [Acidimicrobiales bacterium]
MNTFIESISHHKNVEVEIVFIKVSLNQFISEFNKMTSIEPTITISVDISKPVSSDSRDIYTILIDQSTKSISRSYTRKTTINTMHQNGFNVRAATETPIPAVEFTSSDYTIRAKIRASFAITHKWKHDMTAVFQYTNDIKTVSDLVDKLRFAIPITQSNFIDKIKALNFTKYEIEFEYTGEIQNLTAADIIEIAPTTGFNPVIATAEMLKKQHIYTIKQLLNKAKSLDIISYRDIYPPLKWYITDKIDGERALVYIKDEQIIISTANKSYNIIKNKISDMILDCEKFEDNYYIIDCLYYVNAPTFNMTFDERLKYMEKCGKELGAPFYTKKFIKIDSVDTIKNTVPELIEPIAAYPRDGLIFTSPDKSYLQTINYKWKSADKTTIDFLAKKTGILDEPYYLFNGINHDFRIKIGLGLLKNYKEFFPETNGRYYPVQFSPSINPFAYKWRPDTDDDYDDKIVELAFDTQWRFVRIRADRATEPNFYGNDYKIAEQLYMNCISPLKLEHLWNAPIDLYFQKASLPDRMTGQKFRRDVAKSLIVKYVKNDVIDLGSGRGADIHTYRKVALRLLCIDIDPYAISELISRKLGSFDPVNALSITAACIDLKTPRDILISQCERLGFMRGYMPAIVSNFALHYLCDSIRNIDNILSFISGMLEPGGYFIFTVMDGNSIFNILRTVSSKKWIETNDSAPLYQIDKRYTENSLLPAGQKIAVKLPFQSTMIEEPLCNVEYVISQAAIFQLNLIDRAVFTDIKNDLNALELDYSKLFNYVILQKKI